MLVKLMLTKQKIFYPDKYTELTKNFLKNPKRILPTDIKLKGKQQVQKKTNLLLVCTLWGMILAGIAQILGCYMLQGR